MWKLIGKNTTSQADPSGLVPCAPPYLLPPCEVYSGAALWQIMPSHAGKHNGDGGGAVYCDGVPTLCDWLNSASFPPGIRACVMSHENVAAELDLSANGLFSRRILADGVSLPLLWWRTRFAAGRV